MKSSKFYKRFNINIDSREVEQRFINRAKNKIFDSLFLHDIEEETVRSYVLWQIANDFGVEYDWNDWFDDYIEGEFRKCLQALESSFAALESKKHKKELESLILEIVIMSEIDLGIRWSNGIFLNKGAKLLDDGLVNENLDWLSERKFVNVYKPFEKGLKHFIEYDRRPELGFDVITDMYESLEAFVKIITGRTSKDLSANADLYIRKVQVSDEYKPLLKSYILFANNIRHGSDNIRGKNIVPKHEVESFIYLTGLFIRLGKEFML